MNRHINVFVQLTRETKNENAINANKTKVNREKAVAPSYKRDVARLPLVIREFKTGKTCENATTKGRS